LKVHLPGFRSKTKINKVVVLTNGRHCTRTRAILQTGASFQAATIPGLCNFLILMAGRKLFTNYCSSFVL